MKKLTIASTNQGKIKEIAQMLNELNLTGFEVQSIGKYDLIEPDEPYDTFLENAVHKAKYYGKALNSITIADDSGLCIEALDGFPGVRTKDFVHENGGQIQAFLELQRMLEKHNNYRAYFQSALVIYCPVLDKVLSCEDRESGTLSFPARGTDGFGFDPIFVPDGYDQTMAELGLLIKNEISHRAKALKELMQQYMHTS